MSIPDFALDNWMELAADYTKEEIEAEKSRMFKGVNPRDIKMGLAKRIVALYHGAKAADAAAKEFEARFQKGAMPQNIPEKKIEITGDSMIAGTLFKWAFSISMSET